MKILKYVLDLFRFTHMEAVVNNKTEHPIKDGILNYLKMKTSGALLVTGDWGCGKTYFFKNYLFEEIKSSTSFTPIMVSLFGIKELKELPERALYAYLDKVGNNITSLGKLTQFAKKITDALPFVNNYVDVNKLLGSGDGLYWIIPKEVLICFDDIERAIEVIDINEMLGVINELVENKGYKVIVVANESFITEKEKNKDKNEGKQLIFKEKVIEKTLVYVPNIVTVFKEIALSYKNSDFFDFMSDVGVIQSINPTDESLTNFPKLRKQLSNIRTLKFAIDHFHNVFLLYSTNGKSHKEDSIIKRKLKNYWNFILAVSVEYKLNNISFEDSRTLATYQNVVNIELDLGDKDEVSFDELEDEEEDKQDKQEKAKQDEQYANLFFKKFFIRISEEPIFHKALYDFVTAGIKVDYTKLDENMNLKINIKENKINPAHELLNQFMHGYWRFDNIQATENLKALLEYVKDAKLENYNSYINATVFLYSLKELLDIEDDVLKQKIKEGIDKFTKDVVVSHFVKIETQMAGSHLSENTKWISDYIIELIDSKINFETKIEEEKLEAKFHNNLEDFLKEFLVPEKYSTPKYFNTPILDKFNLEKVKMRVQNLSPNDAMCLRKFVEERYIKRPVEQIKEEKVFLEAINKGLAKIDFSKKSMTNIIVRDNLNPMLDKALRVIEH